MMQTNGGYNNIFLDTLSTSVITVFRMTRNFLVPVGEERSNVFCLRRLWFFLFFLGMPLTER